MVEPSKAAKEDKKVEKTAAEAATGAKQAKPKTTKK